MIFFVDVGYLIQLQVQKENYTDLQQDYIKITQQIQQIVADGHDVQLHIHPHWEKSYYQDGKWQMVTKKAYKLSDFSDKDITRIVRTYKSFLDDLIGYKTTAFRAGGWCIQPFHKLKNIFQELNLKYDSSVFPGGKFISPEYNIDFTQAPHQSQYKFSTDVCEEDKNGFFTEIPISSMRYTPLFFWRLYILGRLRPSQHKMLGDGNFMAQPGRKWNSLTHFTWSHVSSDGYFATKLNSYLKKAHTKKQQNMLIIGHPKSATLFSFKMLEKFISKTKIKHHYTTFKMLN